MAMTVGLMAMHAWACALAWLSLWMF